MSVSSRSRRTLIYWAGHRRLHTGSSSFDRAECKSRKISSTYRTQRRNSCRRSSSAPSLRLCDRPGLSVVMPAVRKTETEKAERPKARPRARPINKRGPRVAGRRLVRRGSPDLGTQRDAGDLLDEADGQLLRAGEAMAKTAWDLRRQKIMLRGAEAGGSPAGPPIAGDALVAAEAVLQCTRAHGRLRARLLELQSSMAGVGEGGYDRASSLLCLAVVYRARAERLRRWAHLTEEGFLNAQTPPHARTSQASGLQKLLPDH